MAYIEEIKRARSVAYVVRYYNKGKILKICLGSGVTRAEAQIVCGLVGCSCGKDRTQITQKRLDAIFEVLPDAIKERLRGIFGDRTQRTNLNDLWNEFQTAQKKVVCPQTVKHDEFAFARFRRYCTVATVEELTPVLLREIYTAMDRDYSNSTVDHTVAVLKSCGIWAEKNGRLEKNPWAEMPKRVFQRNAAREEYVSLEKSCRVLKALPDPAWRALFCLWRFAGLRRSEPLYLTRSSVDFERMRLTVFGEKTRRYGGESRIVPMNKIVAAALRDLLATTPKEQDKLFVFKRDYLSAKFKKLIEKSGVRLWKRPAQNLRVSCENDWIAKGLPVHVVAAWLGHSTRAQQTYYLSITPDSFNKVTDC